MVATGEGFEYSDRIDSPARSSTDIIETLSRIAIQAPKSLKSERPDFSTEFCCLVDQSLRNKPMLRPSNFERIVAKFGND